MNIQESLRLAQEQVSTGWAVPLRKGWPTHACGLCRCLWSWHTPDGAFCTACRKQCRPVIDRENPPLLLDKEAGIVVDLSQRTTTTRGGSDASVS